MQNAKITGIASYVPDYVLTNDELSHMVDTNDEWITTRVGIKERRILKGEGTGSSDLGVKAVAELLKKTGVKPSEVDLLICATSNPDYRFPSTASIVLEKLGIKTAYGYDIQAACAGFIVALQAGTAPAHRGRPVRGRRRRRLLERSLLPRWLMQRPGSGIGRAGRKNRSRRRAVNN